MTKTKGRRLLLVAAILLTALNLRTALASVSPVFGSIQSDLGIGRAVVGLAVTLPVLCMGIFAPVATAFERWAGGRRWLILGAVALIGAATAVRFEGGLVTLFASALAAGIGIAVAQALLPQVIKRNFPESPATVTGAYTASMAVGATLAASTTVPLARAFGSWAPALAVWGAFALPAILSWLPLHEEEEEQESSRSDDRKLPLRAPRVWLVVVFLAITSLMYYSILSWIAPLYEDAGLSRATAGLLLSTFTGVQILSAFLVPAVANRFTDRRPILVLIISITVVALPLAAFVPAAQPWTPWTWAALLGFSQGALFPLALTLPLDNTRSPEMAGKLTSACFLVGYTLAATGPTLIGAARDATGGFAIPFTVLAAISLFQILLAVRATPGVNVEDQAEGQGVGNR